MADKHQPNTSNACSGHLLVANFNFFFTWHHEEGEEGKWGGWNTADAYSVPDQLLACYISRRKLIQI